LRKSEGGGNQKTMAGVWGVSQRRGNINFKGFHWKEGGSKTNKSFRKGGGKEPPAQGRGLKKRLRKVKKGYSLRRGRGTAGNFKQRGLQCNMNEREKSLSGRPVFQKRVEGILTTPQGVFLKLPLQGGPG